MANANYSRRQIMEAEACTACRLCADNCPAVSATQDGRLSGAFRLKELQSLFRARTGLWRRLFGRREPSEEEQRRFSETVFRCTLCGNCQEVCPVGIHLKDMWLSLRRDLVKSKFYPPKIDLIRDNLAQSRNVFDEDNEERAEWVEDMKAPPDHGYVKEEAEVVYFTGCVAAFYPLAQQIPMALAEIMDAAGEDFTLLGEEEWCCGFPLLGAGLTDEAQEIIDHNLAAVAKKGAKRIVFACPSCFEMWREYYPPRFELVHETQLLLEMIRQGRLPLKRLNMKVTYHDPCDLGRGAREFEAPREIIKALPGLELVELAHSREDCRCCGGGGNLEMIDAGLSTKIAEAKLKEVAATGAEAVITACQQCVRTMTTFARRNQSPLKVMDIAQLVRQALEK